MSTGHFAIHRAIGMAYAAHHGQFRKYTGEPYIVHPKAVAEIIAQFHDDELSAAAWLHDTIEDTFVTDELLSELFSLRTRALVNELTNIYTREAFPTKNRNERFLLELTRLSTISADAQTIKYADLIDNTKSIIEHDQDFAVVYLKEKAQVLEALTKGDSRIRKQALEQISTLTKEVVI